MRMGCTQVLWARVSSMGWVPGIQPPGCLSQMLQLDVPDALPVCQPMLITCPLGCFLLCPKVMCRHFAPVCKHMYYPQMTLCSQKLLEKFLPLRPLTKGCFAWKLQWDLSWYIVWCFCGVVCWAMWDWVDCGRNTEHTQRKSTGSTGAAHFRIGCFWWWGLIYPDGTQSPRLASEQLQPLLLAGYNLMSLRAFWPGQ